MYVLTLRLSDEYWYVMSMAHAHRVERAGAARGALSWRYNFSNPSPPPRHRYIFGITSTITPKEGGGRASFSIITFIKLILDAAPAHCTVFTPLHSIYTTARRNLTKLANKNHSGRIQGGGWLWKLSPLANNKGSYCRSTPPPWISKNIWFLVGSQANVFKKLQAPPPLRKKPEYGPW